MISSVASAVVEPYQCLVVRTFAWDGFPTMLTFPFPFKKLDSPPSFS